MDFELTEEQAMLREVSRSMLSAHCPATAVRALAESAGDLDEKLWRRGAELGWTGLVVPEEAGGAGQGLVELCLVAEELGRAVAPGPVVETALVARALAAGATGVAGDVLEGLLEGGLRAGWAHHGSVLMSVDGDDVVLDGAAAAVQAAGSVDVLLVSATGPDGDVLVLVDAASLGEVGLRRNAGLDQTRGWYDVSFTGTCLPRDRVLVCEPAEVRWYLDAAMVLVAADALGAGEALLAMTVQHALVREQFGRPLGAFQSVKHKLADMLTITKGVRASTYYAAMALDSGAADASLAASVAKAFSGPEIARLAGEALQTHGGIGFTWEHDLHLYLRRAKVDEARHGSPAELHERIVALIE
ncbi:acyl-CoA/acyl-ACP dehydrogenase [Nocardioides sp. cx-169]|uniref:acyl-CoA dehydrogenase family protein n=1 Tax=Nocardioides sp. cx-169 TaxID=2899080 RepID=UPI001E5A8435|nr:acyl-CoA dehydrogenase family protein [Nocardioides sp. cx-169]MCD4533034.1 acyl-CoA/acyl-ACP dehydrogenase [Nocardioides sp. cx-169]